MLSSLKFFLILTTVISWSNKSWATFHFDGKIAVFDAGKKSEHQVQVEKTLKQSLAPCPACRIKQFPIYEENGDLLSEKFIKAIQAADRQGFKLFHFSWNMPSSLKTKTIEQALNQLVKNGVLIVAAAGAPTRDQEFPLDLENTVMGSIEKNTLLIGETNEKGFLSPDSNFGKKLFTALKPPANQKGSSFSAPVLTAAIANWWYRNPKLSADEVFAHLLKQKGLKFLPSQQELFPK